VTVMNGWVDRCTTTPCCTGQCG